MHVKFNLGVFFISRGQLKEIDITNQNKVSPDILANGFLGLNYVFWCFNLRKPVNNSVDISTKSTFYLLKAEIKP